MQAGTQHCKCKEYGKKYSLNPKTITYPAEIRMEVIRIYHTFCVSIHAGTEPNAGVRSVASQSYFKLCGVPPGLYHSALSAPKWSSIIIAAASLV
ncbi:MAG: hypothetical protein LBM98_13150 [Oscillospiraceae bacterium]|nr:hypothetical protein [Oscillospiraceae bacterium]